MAALDKLLDRGEQRAAARADLHVDTFRVEDASSIPQYHQVPPPAPHPGPLPMNASTLDTGTTMALPSGAMSKTEIEELVT